MKKLSIPHPIPYQGSKRNLAPKIIKFAPPKIDTLYEPFAGSAAFTLFAANQNYAKHYVIGDAFTELIVLWRAIIFDPELTANRYEAIWRGQREGDFDYFNKVREQFNNDRDEVKLLYLIARCVKNAVRFNRHGQFTQSADKRRLGMNPQKMRANIRGASEILKRCVTFHAGDFRECVEAARPGDLVYMDPPYQGTTYGRDKRYFTQVETEYLYKGLAHLNESGVDYLLSYDGSTGEKTYGEELPEYLEATRMHLHAGRSSQATLLGKEAKTIESLYVSRGIKEFFDDNTDTPKQFAMTV